MKQNELLENLKAIRISLEGLERGQNILLSLLVDTYEESEGKLSMQDMSLDNPNKKSEKNGFDFKLTHYD